MKFLLGLGLMLFVWNCNSSRAEDQSSAEVTHKFEYCVTVLNDYEQQRSVTLLNYFGREGWELVAMRHYSSSQAGSNETYDNYVFKRSAGTKGKSCGDVNKLA